MKQPRSGMIQQHPRAHTHPYRIDRFNDAVDHVRGCFEEVGPEEVEEVDHGVFAAEADDAEGDVFDDAGGGLAVDLVAVDEGVFEEGDDGVDVVFAHFGDVFELGCVSW